MNEKQTILDLINRVDSGTKLTINFTGEGIEGLYLEIETKKNKYLERNDFTVKTYYKDLVYLHSDKPKLVDLDSDLLSLLFKNIYFYYFKPTSKNEIFVKAEYFSLY